MEAQKDFEQFCSNNGVKPTNTKADFYLAGHYRGQQVMLDKVCDYIRTIFYEGLVIYREDAWYGLDEFIEKLKEDLRNNNENKKEQGLRSATET